MNIIQQILSLSTDFFNTNMESLVTGQASLTDVTLAVQEFVQKLGREVLSAMLEQADEAICWLYKSLCRTWGGRCCRQC